MINILDINSGSLGHDVFYYSSKRSILLEWECSWVIQINTQNGEDTLYDIFLPCLILLVVD